MATDETTQPQEGAEQEPEGQLSPEQQQLWEDRLKRYGLTPKEEEPKAPEQPAAAKETPKPEAQPPAPITPKTMASARAERRQQLRRQEEMITKLSEQVASLSQELQKSRAPAPPDPNKDPDLYTAELIKKALSEVLPPETVAYLQGLQKRDAEQEEFRQQLVAEDAFFAERAAELADYEADYFTAHPERKEAYGQNVATLTELIMGQQYEMGLRAGKRGPELELHCKRTARAGIYGLMKQALDAGLNPVEYWDEQWSKVPPGGPANGGTNGHDPKKTQTRENRETAARAGAASAGSTLSSVKAPPQASPEGKVAAAVADHGGRPGAARAAINAAKRAGGDPKALLRAQAREQ